MDDALDTLLALKADKVDVLEATRIKTENRLRAFQQGFDFSDDNPYVTDEQWMLEQLMALEAEAIKELETLVKRHRMWGFMEPISGIGAKQGGRLLAAIGDPYMRPAITDDDDNVIEEPRPRHGPAELWQYCGHGDPARSRRRKGHRVEYNPTAKKRLWLVSKQVIKYESVYREFYDNEREFKKDAVHTVKCPQCTNTGGIGQPWKPGHQHAHALRYVGKLILLDMFMYSKDLHEQEAKRRKLKRRRLAQQRAAAAR